MGLAYLRSHSISNAIDDLLGKVEDPTAFTNAFGCDLSDTETITRLVDAKTISISRLMDFVPEGTMDPTPFIYDSTCYAAAGLMTLSFLSNLAIRPLDYIKIVNELNTNTIDASNTNKSNDITNNESTTSNQDHQQIRRKRNW